VESSSNNERTAVATSTDEFGDFYDERRAASDLKRYREKGPRPWTKTLIESLMAEGVEGATLLDIGGGVGVIHHELLAAGVGSATCADASAANLATARVCVVILHLVARHLVPQPSWS
jgi:ubiquinone/menaquinone biosynthesis C-methylase UbiE